MCTSEHIKPESDFRVMHCSSTTKNMNSTISSTFARDQITCKTGPNSPPGVKRRNSRSSTSGSATIIIFIVISIYLFPISSTQALAAEDNFSPAIGAYNVDMTGDPSVNHSTESDSPPVIGVPKLLGVHKPRKDRKKKRSKCPKQFRKTFCLNRGRCRWITDLEQPTCRCKKSWKGERCGEPWIEFTGDENTQQDVVTLVVVLSSFGFVGIIMTTCICWRRFKSVRNQLEHEENQQVMLTSQRDMDTSVVQLTKT